MTLLWLDGFGTYGDTGNTAPQPTGVLAASYLFVNAEAQFDTELTVGPQSDDCLEFPANVYSGILTTQDITTNETMIAGCHIWRTGDNAFTADNDWPIFVFKDGTTSSLRLVCANDSFYVCTGNETVLGAAQVKTEVQVWHYIEMKATARTNNTGTVEVRINNCPVITLTGVVTALGSNNYYTRCSLGDNRAMNAAAATRVDNFYVCDGAGSTNNDFLGTVYVDVVFPDGDDSVNFATTGNSANHFENIGLSDAMWTTDYIEDDATGNRDIFTVEATQNFATIYGVQVSALTLGVTANQNYHIVVDSNSTETESTNLAATVSVNATGRYVVELDPDTSNAWTPATVNAMKFGIELQ